MKNQRTIEITDALIARYLSGESTPEEAIALHAWLESRGHREDFERTERTWHLTHPTRSSRPVNRDAAWRSAHLKATGNRESLAFPEEHHTSSRRRLRTLFQIVASIIILFGAGLGAYFLLSEKELPQITYTSQQLPEEHILPDESHVILNRHSTLRYADNFSGKLRGVTLSGEAFFSVTKNTEKPFVVHTAVADIHVVGTTFNVSEAHGELEVSVSEGKVLVITKHDSSYLEPGQKGVIRVGLRPIHVTATADANTWGYATHRFEFKNTPLKDVLRCLEKSYPCTIELRTRTVANCRLNATFENDSAEDIIQQIAKTLDLSYTHKDQTFILDGKGCPP